MVLRKSKDGQVYGISYVDHKSQCVFNGSSIGKQYSAKRILESCEQNISNNKKDIINQFQLTMKAFKI